MTVPADGFAHDHRTSHATGHATSHATSHSTGAATGAALHVHGAVVSLGSTRVLDGINVELDPGGSVALIGPNGAGKSTLIKAILGLLPLVGGSITVLGRSPAEARIDVAYVPQIDDLDPHFPVSVLGVVLMGRYRRIGWFRRPDKHERAIAMNALETVGLAERAKDRFGVLSGGQRQRVLVARAVAQEAKLLLLDEPFNGVDSTTQSVLLDVLDRLRADGTALVMSTHDLAVAHLACKDCLLLNRHQVAFGPVADVLTDDLLRETYGPPALRMRQGQSTVTVT